MPHVDGIEATRQIKTQWPEVQIVALVMNLRQRDLALDAGADGVHVESQRAVLVVRAEQPVQGNDGGQEGGDPDDTRRNSRQQFHAGPDAERKQADDHQQEDDRKQQFGAAAESQQQIPPDQGEKCARKASACLLCAHASAPETRK